MLKHNSCIIQKRRSKPRQEFYVTIFPGEKLLTSPVAEQEVHLPSPNQLRHKVILKNKKLRGFADFGAGAGGLRSNLSRTTTMEDAPDNDDEYDSDFGEDEFEDETGTLWNGELLCGLGGSFIYQISG